jgi:hypothetical protein
MKKHILFTLLILLSSITGSITFSQKNNQWTGTDALGRKLDDNFEVGSLKKNKYVGMFYWTWHTDGNATYPLYDITQILKQNPEAESQVDHPAWGGISEGGIYWWDQPLFG